MSKFKNPRANKAVEIFKVHNLKEIYITEDLLGFTDKNKAEDRARYLKDKTVEHFKKGFEATYSDDEEPAKDQEPKDLTEREQLLEEYAQLFGKSAAHNIGTEKLKAQVEEKRKENAQP